MSQHRPVTGFYPGTFDPVTWGHLDIVRRSARFVGHLIIGVAQNTGKNPLLCLADRVACVQEAVSHISNESGIIIDVQPFSGLLIDAVRQAGASIIVRGLRGGTDFDYEWQMTDVNSRLAPDIETVFLLARHETQSISSRLVREIATCGGDISAFAPPEACSRVRAALGK